MFTARHLSGIFLVISVMLLCSCRTTSNVQIQKDRIDQTDISSGHQLQQLTTHLEQSDYNLSIVTIIEHYAVDPVTGTTYLADRTTQQATTQQSTCVADSTSTQVTDTVSIHSSSEQHTTTAVDVQSSFLMPSDRVIMACFLLSIILGMIAFWLKRKL